MKRPKLHPKAPGALKREYRRLGTMQAVADFHHVNIFYVQQLLVEGRIPADPTIAEKLHVCSQALKRMPVPDARRRHIKWFRRLTPRQRDQAIEFLYHYKENESER